MKRAERVFLLTSFLQGAFNWMVFIGAQVYRVTEVGMDPFALVLAGTALEVSSFIFEIPTGVVADLYSRRLSVIIGFLITGIGFCIEGVAPLVLLVIISQMVWGLGWTFISGAKAAWITDEVGVDAAAPLFIRGTQLNYVGIMVGGTAGVILANYSLRMPFLISGALYMLMGLLMIFIMPESGFQKADAGDRQTWEQMKETLRIGVEQVRSSRPLLLFFLSLLFVGLYSEGFDRLWEPFFLESITFPQIGGVTLSTVTWFGIIQAGSIWLILLGSEIVKRVVKQDECSIMHVLPWLYAVVVLALLCLSFMDMLIPAAVLIWVVYVFRSVAYPLGITWINHQTESKVRATMLSFASQVDALGQMTGGPMLGGIGSFFSLRWALRGSAALMLPAVGVLLKLERSTNGD